MASSSVGGVQAKCPGRGRAMVAKRPCESQGGMSQRDRGVITNTLSDYHHNELAKVYDANAAFLFRRAEGTLQFNSYTYVRKRRKPNMRRFIDRISEIISRYRYRTAFTDGKETLTYLQLETESAKVYRFLKERGIGREQFVTILMPRNIHFFSCMLGVWKAGAAYVMMEEGYPAERVSFIQKNCGSLLTIDQALTEKILSEYEPLYGHEETDVHDAAYAVYTSGSTGNPKGVLHEYGNVDQCAAVTPEKEEYPESVFAYSAALNFVAAQLYLIDATLSAKTVFLISGDLLRDYDSLQKTLEDQRVETIFFPPSFLRHYEHPARFLKKIYSGSAPANDIYFPNGPAVEHNYAMSETGFFLFQYILDRSYDIPPLGKPTLPVHEVLLREDDTLVEGAGEQGELCFVNDYIRGYIDLPEQTARAFRPSPFDPSVRLFHTGDMAYRDEEGKYYIAGRIDDMMKIDGNRIEPAEIEAAIKKLTGLEDVMVRGFQDKSRSYVAAYVIEKEATEKGLWSASGLAIDREALSGLLPYYMIPTYFMAVEQFPKNANGKFVRKALPAPDIAKFFAEYAAPETELQKLLCEQFEQVLQLSKIGIHDDFYALGGDSLATLTLLSMLNLPGLSAMDIFRGRTPENIAAAYEPESRANGQSAAERELSLRGKAYPLTAFQLNIFDYQLCAPQSCMWNIPMLFTLSAQSVDAPRFRDAVQKMMDHHPVFRTTVYFDEDGKVVQCYDPSIAIAVELERMSEDAFHELKSELNHPIRMIRSPLFQVRVILTEEHLYFYLLSHHIMIDGGGLNVLFQSLWAYYEGTEEPPMDTWFTYLDEEQKNTEEKRYEQAARYFRHEYAEKDWCRNLKADHVSNDLDINLFAIQSALTAEKLEGIKQSTQLSANELCAAIALLAMADTEGEKDVMLHWVFQNRITPESETAAGLTIRLLPVGVSLSEGDDSDLSGILRQVSSRIRDGIAHSSNDWCLDNESVFQNDALFLVYEGSIMDMESMQNHNALTEILPNPDHTGVRRTALQVSATPAGLVFRFIYIDALYDAAHIAAFQSSMEKWINRLS